MSFSISESSLCWFRSFLFPFWSRFLGIISIYFLTKLRDLIKILGCESKRISKRRKIRARDQLVVVLLLKVFLSRISGLKWFGLSAAAQIWGAGRWRFGSSLAWRSVAPPLKICSHYLRRPIDVHLTLLSRQLRSKPKLEGNKDRPLESTVPTITQSDYSRSIIEASSRIFNPVNISEI